MTLTQTQDTSTQAMTEVALGLSMAFFAILIVALLSMGLPEEEASTESPNVPDFVQLQSNTNEVEEQKSDSTQYALFYQNKLYSDKAQLISVDQLSKTDPLVLGVAPDVSLNDIIQLKQTINHPNLSITALNPEWLQRLKRTP